MPPSSRASSSANDPADAAGFAAARDICRQHARSFFLCSYFLPPHKRNAAYAVYAFCRMIDDAIDAPADGGEGCSSDTLASRLEMFEQRLDEIYADRLDLPNVEFRTPQQHALHAFSLTVQEYTIPRQYFSDLAEGCRMDLTVVRYASWTALEKYCYHVAGVIGLIMSGVFGLTHSDAGKNAVMMGNAMQLTNILRDIGEDYGRGRIYLPLEDMVRFGYSEKDLGARVVNEPFRKLMQFEVARARQMYQLGAEGLCWLAGDGSRLTASAMAVIYSGILDAIEAQDYGVFSARARLSFLQKLRRLPRAWKLAGRMPGDAMQRCFE
jgi:phytoene synthase